MKRLTLFLFLAIASIAAGDDPQLDVIAERVTAVVRTKTITVEQTEIDGLKLEVPAGETVSDPVEVPAAMIIVNSNAPRVRVKCRTARLTQLDEYRWILAEPGRHWVDVLGLGIVDGQLFFEEADVLVELDGVPDPPDPVDPPEPDPEPEPEPDPDDPDAPPIPLSGFRVLMIYETADLPMLPESQRQVLYSGQVRQFLGEHCVDEDSRPAYRILDDDSQFVDSDSSWASAMKRPRNSLPWLIVSNGKTGYEGPLPGSVGETLQLLQKYLPR